MIELMVTVAVAAILAAIAVPNLRTFILNTRRDSMLDALVASLHYARTQAIDLNETTYLCAGTGGATADTPPCATAAWSSGWQVIGVPANSGSTPKLLATHALNDANTTPGLAAVNGNVYFQFNGNGTVTIPSGAATETIRVCDPRGVSYARAVEINSAGFIQSSAQAGQDPTGQPITSCP